MKGKNLFRLFLILLVSSFIIFSVGCKKDESPVEPTPQVNESEILLKHFE